jgi:trehalose-phosphatase
MAQHLFDQWRTVAGRVERAGALRLFLDFDGTLVPIRRSPDRVALSARTRRALGRLAEHRRVAAVIVSGRRRRALRDFVRLEQVEYWGLYGWERGRMRLARLERRHLSRLRASLTAGCRDLAGVTVEDKGFSVAVHTRGASERAASRAHALIERAIGGPNSPLYVLPGLQVWDVLPRQVRGKGFAMAAALSRLSPPCLPIYIGDDATDEPAFAALGRGITVRVGAPRATEARYWLANPAEVRVFMERLDRELS